MGEIAADMREGLLALAVGAGLQVMPQLMEADVTAVRAAGPARCGPGGDPARHQRGSVTLGGRRVPIAGRGSGRSTAPGSCRCRRMSCSAPPSAGRDGDGADAGRGVDPALPGRLGAGRRAGRARGDGDQQVGGVAEVRGDDRDRPGGSARRGPVRAGPGGVDDRRSALRRPSVRGGAGHRHRRHQAPAGAGRGIDREHHPGPRSAGRAAGPRPGRHQADPGRAGRRQGACRRRSRTCSTTR